MLVRYVVLTRNWSKSFLYLHRCTAYRKTLEPKYNYSKYRKCNAQYVVKIPKRYAASIIILKFNIGITVVQNNRYCRTLSHSQIQVTTSMSYSGSSVNNYRKKFPLKNKPQSSNIGNAVLQGFINKLRPR